MKTYLGAAVLLAVVGGLLVVLGKAGAGRPSGDIFFKGGQPAGLFSAVCHHLDSQISSIAYHSFYAPAERPETKAAAMRC